MVQSIIKQLLILHFEQSENFFMIIRSNFIGTLEVIFLFSQYIHCSIFPITKRILKNNVNIQN